MSARKSWSQLTPSYRARLERQGITAATHASASKVEARGYHPRKGAVNRNLYNRVVSNEGTVQERRTLAEQFTWPDWVPRTVSRQRGSRGRRYRFNVQPDVAAGLSLLPNPKSWRDVEFVPRPNGEPWTMIVTLKNGNTRSILIPGGGGPGSGAKEVLEIVTELEEAKVNVPRTRRTSTPIDDTFFEVTGTDEDTFIPPAPVRTRPPRGPRTSPPRRVTVPQRTKVATRKPQRRRPNPAKKYGRR